MYDFKVNGVVFPYPKKFTPERVDNIVASYMTLNGNVVGDKRGWRYGDTTLEWAYLETEQIQWLLNQAKTPFTITFMDITGQEVTTKVTLTSTGGTNVFRFINDKPCYTDIKMGVMFTDVINE